MPSSSFRTGKSSAWPSIPTSRKGGILFSRVLGFHGLVPYVWVVLDRFAGIRYFLFEPNYAGGAPKQILAYLKENPTTRLAVATDSGGPYGVVRRSLIRMSLASQRPLVGISAKFSRSVTLWSHFIPLPGTVLRFVVYERISPSELDSLTEKEALERVQTAFSGLA